MPSFFERLTTGSFMPHGHCYFWRPDILWLHVGSNAIIALAYFLIPISLLYILRHTKKDVPQRDVLYLFIAFITFCGISHLTEILTTWVPAYQLEGWIKAITASISMTTALVLIPKLPDIVGSRGLQEKLIDARKQISSMELKLNQMSSVYQASLGREDRIVQLKLEVNKELANQGLAPRYDIYEGKT